MCVGMGGCVCVHLCECMTMCVLRHVCTCVHNKINYVHNFMICMGVAYNQPEQYIYVCVDKSIVSCVLSNRAICVCAKFPIMELRVYIHMYVHRSNTKIMCIRIYVHRSHNRIMRICMYVHRSYNRIMRICMYVHRSYNRIMCIRMYVHRSYNRIMRIRMYVHTSYKKLCVHICVYACAQNTY